MDGLNIFNKTKQRKKMKDFNGAPVRNEQPTRGI
jgi:hypothetical protein